METYTPPFRSTIGFINSSNPKFALKITETKAQNIRE